MIPCGGPMLIMSKSTNDVFHIFLQLLNLLTVLPISWLFLGQTFHSADFPTKSCCNAILDTILAIPTVGVNPAAPGLTMPAVMLFITIFAILEILALNILKKWPLD